MENTSGMGSSAAVPPEIDRWNWGAFLLHWIWGIRHNVWRALLVFVPFVGFFMLFVLGAKGSAWAWQSKRWESIESFQAAQRSWTRWGVGLLVAGGLIAVCASIATFSMLKSSEAYLLSVAALEASPEAARLIGKPMETGIPMGNLRVSGPDGAAALSYSVKGPKGEGEVHLEAERSLGRWTLRRMVLKHKDDWIDIVTEQPKGVAI